MFIKNLKITNYRNYESKSLDFEENQQIYSIIGNNGAGKTNILEAIYILALTKSFRSSNSQDLIMWEKDFTKITGVINSKNEDTKLEVFIGKGSLPKRVLKKNDVKINAYDFIGNCKVVFFNPEDLNILYLGPDLRRKYLDILNVQLSKKYLISLRKYKRIIEQRNSLLKRIKEGFASVNDLDIWNEQMALEGSKIIEERIKTTNFININLKKVYSTISEKEEDIKLIYKSPIDYEDGISIEYIRKFFIEKIVNSTEEDIKRQVTTIGPHRDDLKFYLRNLPIAMHASRGEYRSLILALKLIELEYIKKNSGESPILLLDDVFSELDQKRQNAFMEGIKEYQTILTATNTENNYGKIINCY